MPASRLPSRTWIAESSPAMTERETSRLSIQDVLYLRAVRGGEADAQQHAVRAVPQLALELPGQAEVVRQDRPALHPYGLFAQIRRLDRHDAAVDGADPEALPPESEERGVGKECVTASRSRGLP